MVRTEPPDRPNLPTLPRGAEHRYPGFSIPPPKVLRAMRQNNIVDAFWKLIQLEYPTIQKKS